MLPPIDEAVLKNNPDFAQLYTTLTTVILNADGSTKSDAGAKERAAKAREARLRAAKNHLLVQAISTIAAPAPTTEAASAADSKIGGAVARRAARATSKPALVPPSKPANDLPPDLMDLLMLLPPLLQLAIEPETSSSSGSSLSAEDMELLLSSPPFTSLPEHLPRLAELVSDNLQNAARGLARVVNPSTNPSYLHRAVPGIPAQIAALQQSIIDTRIQLANARHETATALLELLDLEAASMTGLIRTLETKHGPVARSLELRAAEVALGAQTGEVDAQATHAAAVKVVYPPDSEAALQNYSSHLRDSKMRLEETIRERKALLKEYGIDVDAKDDEGSDGKGKARTMREMARVYREMGQQVEDVRNDLARLGR